VNRAVLALTLAAALFPFGSAATAQTQPSGGGPTVTVYTLDEYGEGALIRPARPVAGYEDWLTVGDLPPDAFDPERYKYFRISLAVGADDSVTDCQPVRDAPADLAARACEAIRARGRFVHALDASGKAESSTQSWAFCCRC
jgi:hypothetical protein